jgi:hypothetical protein
VAEAHGVWRRPKVEGAVVEDAVHRPDQRSTIGRGRGERQKRHTHQSRADLIRTEAAFRGEDAAEMPAGARGASIQEILQCGEVRR